MKELGLDPVYAGLPDTTDEAVVPEAEPNAPDRADRETLPVEMVDVVFQPGNEVELEPIDTG